MLPLHGLSFCCTAIPAEKRLKIELKVLEMGGSYSLDLMSHINYLIVGDTQTAKYIYCIKNRFDITFLTPDAIDAAFEQYQKGEKIDLSGQKLPIFHNFNFCISHIKSDDLFDLTPVNVSTLKLYIVDNKGKFTDSLTVTHNLMITNVKSGKRYSKAVEWGIPVVHPKFIFDSIKRKAVVNIDDYRLENYPDFPELELPEEYTEPLVPKDLRIKKNVQVWNSIMTRKRPRDEEGESEQYELEQTEEPTKKASSSVFKGMTFKLVSFSDKQISILSNVIKKNGGRIVKSSSMYTLIPFGSNKEGIKVEGKLKTEWFVERCIYYNKVVDDEWSDPIDQIATFKQFDVCLSGFKGIEQLHITKLCELIGFKVKEKFNSSVNLLIINIEIFKSKLPTNLFYNDISKCSYNSISSISTKNKVIASKNWKIPIVSINYLFETINNNESDLTTYPNIKDLKWCLYYPSECDNDLISYLNSQKSQISDSFNVPSPKKIQKSFGKLLTNSRVDFNELDSKTAKLAKNDTIDDLSFEMDIGYENSHK